MLSSSGAGDTHGDDRPAGNGLLAGAAPGALGMGLLFYPRGGSAQVAGYLARELVARGWALTLATGSLGAPGQRSNAATFFDGLEGNLLTYDHTPAVDAWTAGRDPMDEPRPLHPSLEAREGVPDRVATMLSPAQAEAQVDAWAALLASSPSFRASDVLHLHHVTALHDAAGRVCPQVPVVTHLHGTELKLLDAIERAEAAGELGRPGGSFEHGAHWRERMRAAAHRAQQTIVISPHDRSGAARLLGIDEATVTWLPNGVDETRFHPRSLPADERRQLWQRWLVDDAQGWDESGEPGSIRYDPAEVDAAFGFGSDASPNPVLLFVGRFLDFKRVPLLVRAYARARENFAMSVPLVIWGGAPGEWEGEHPATVAHDLGVRDVFFAGWRGHDDLPLGLACSDVLVAPSTDEPFGQVYLEAMGCGLPVVGTQSGGPPSFVNVDPARLDGWLVTPDDEAALTAAILEAVASPSTRRERGANAVEHVRADYTWRGLAPRFEAVYAAARGN